jgi:CheY-like chemotaxis protein
MISRPCGVCGELIAPDAALIDNRGWRYFRHRQCLNEKQLVYSRKRPSVRKTRNVLIVNEDPVQLSLASFQLRVWGFYPLTAQNSSSALALLSTNEIEAIVVLNLSDSEGFLSQSASKCAKVLIISSGLLADVCMGDKFTPMKLREALENGSKALRGNSAATSPVVQGRVEG